MTTYFPNMSHLYAYNTEVTEQISIELCTGAVPLETRPSSHFVISYSQ
jgi:hypothetical protein